MQYWHRRALFARLLLVAAVLCATGVVAAPRRGGAFVQHEDGPTARALIFAELERGRLDYATALLYRGYAIFAPELLPAELAGSRLVDEDRAFFYEAKVNWAALPGDVRDKLTPYLVRPTDARSISFRPAGASAAAPEATGPSCENGWTSRVSARFAFKVWMHCVGDYDGDLAAAITTIEEFWEAEVALMGPPIPDLGTSEAGGDDRIDFYFVDDEQDLAPRPSASNINAGAAAHAAADEPFVGNTSSAHVIARRPMIGDPVNTLTLAHEFFHVLQDAHNTAISFGYVLEPGARFDTIRHTEYWFTEATANWVMSYLYRDTLPRVVARVPHGLFVDVFQTSNASLHISPSYSGGQFLHIYSAYIWFLFMEQERGPHAIAEMYDKLRPIDQDDWDGAMAVLNEALPFETHFRDFAVRNLNLDLQPGDPISPSYKELDPSFPEGIRPPLAVGEGSDRIIAQGESREVVASIPSLSALYYSFVPHETVDGVALTFAGLTPGAALDVDLIVKIKNRGWERRQLPIDAPTTLCASNPADHVEAFYLVVSNHDLDFDTSVAGSFTVADADCG